MITGDNPLTACHIAKELKMTVKPHTLITTEPSKSQGWRWESVDGAEVFDISTETLSKLKSYDLCITGEVSVNITSAAFHKKTCSFMQ